MRKAFRARVRLRVPVWVGNALLLRGIGVGVPAVVACAVRNADADPDRLLGVDVAPDWGCSWSRPLALAAGSTRPRTGVVGRLVGHPVHRLLPRRPAAAAPGLKTDYATYLRAEPDGASLDARQRRHRDEAGAVPGPGLLRRRPTLPPGRSLRPVGPRASSRSSTDVLFSTKSSDWKKVRRERRGGAREDERFPQERAYS